MPKTHQPRSGSLQFWPRKRAKKFLPSANWGILQKKYKDEKGLLGFIGYKVGMLRALVNNLTPHSLTKNKKIIIPLTLIECPPIKILDIRFYKNGKVAFDILNDGLDKELKRKLKLPKKKDSVSISKKLDELEKEINKFDDIHIIAYSTVKKTKLKKTPDLAEIGLAGGLTEKLNFIKEHLNKEINIKDIFSANQVLDIRGLTKGHGLVGPVRRFGIGLKQKKSEKGQRRPGSVGPWKPSRVTFRAPMAGQYGFFTRIKYNSKLVGIGAAGDFKRELLHYDKLNTDYILIKGSVNGPSKRQLLIVRSLRETKKTVKENFEIIKLLR